MTLAQMVCAISLAVFVDPEFDQHYRGFLLSYVAFRGVLILMYRRAATTAEVGVSVARYLANGFTLGLLVSFSSLAFDGYWKYAVLYTGIIIDMLVPVVGRQRLKQIPVQGHHMPERFGLLTIILLGESVANLVSSLEGVGFSSEVAVAAIAGFVWTAAIWWIYYENLEHRIYGRALGTGQATIYLHLLIYIFLGGIANTIRFAIDPVLTVLDYKMLAGVSTIGFVVSLEILHVTYHRKSERRPLIVTGLVLFTLAAAGIALSPTSLITLFVIAGVFVCYAVVDAIRRDASSSKRIQSL